MATAILSLEPQDILFDFFILKNFYSITIALVALKFSNHHTKHFGCIDGLFSEHHLRDGFHSPLMHNARVIFVPSLKDNQPSAGVGGGALLLRAYPSAWCPAQKGHPISMERRANYPTKERANDLTALPQGPRPHVEVPHAQVRI